MSSQSLLWGKLKQDLKKGAFVCVKTLVLQPERKNAGTFLNKERDIFSIERSAESTFGVGLNCFLETVLIYLGEE